MATLSSNKIEFSWQSAYFKTGIMRLRRQKNILLEKPEWFPVRGGECPASGSLAFSWTFVLRLANVPTGRQY